MQAVVVEELALCPSPGGQNPLLDHELGWNYLIVYLIVLPYN